MLQTRSDSVKKYLLLISRATNIDTKQFSFPFDHKLVSMVSLLLDPIHSNRALC